MLEIFTPLEPVLHLPFSQQEQGFGKCFLLEANILVLWDIQSIPQPLNSAFTALEAAIESAWLYPIKALFRRKGSEPNLATGHTLLSSELKVQKKVHTAKWK